jgi:hypothetical protein
MKREKKREKIAHAMYPRDPVRLELTEEKKEKNYAQWHAKTEEEEEEEDG